MSKFGFETTTNLKSEVTRLQGEVQRLEETNKKQLETIAKIQASSGVVIGVVEEVAENKATTKDTVTNIIDARRKKADTLLNNLPCSCEENTDTVVQDKEQNKQTVASIPTVEKPKKQNVSQVVVDQLSADNIDALNEAYDSFFQEPSK